MASHVCMMNRLSILLVILTFASSIVTSSLGEIEFSNLQEVEIQTHLKRLNKPAIKSIQSPDGDIIDCVHIANQPAFDHPLLRNHTIQITPSFGDVSPDKEEETELVTQLWHTNGECPDNTIPIRRTKREDLLRWNSMNSIRNNGEKNPNIIPKSESKLSLNQEGDPNKHEFAIMMTDKPGTYLGSGARINVWKPFVEYNEVSFSRLTLLSGNDPNINAIESGWQVHHTLYGDFKTRFYISWTINGRKSEGCYNLLCQGFVQTNKRVAVGGTLNHVSTYNGEQFKMMVDISKDSGDGNWWLKLNDKRVGYWPKELFSFLRDSAGNVQWGGEIVSTRGLHTKTAMGSGHFPQEGYRKASFFGRIYVIDGSNVKQKPEGLRFFITDNHCYDLVVKGPNPNITTDFLYGGPGLNPNCEI